MEHELLSDISLLQLVQQKTETDLECLLSNLSVSQYYQVPIPVMLLQSGQCLCSAVTFVLYFSIPGSLSILHLRLSDLKHLGDKYYNYLN